MYCGGAVASWLVRSTPERTNHRILIFQLVRVLYDGRMLLNDLDSLNSRDSIGLNIVKIMSLAGRKDYFWSKLTDIILQWNPDFSNLQGKHKLVREIGEFGKSGIKLQCLTEKRERLMVRVIGRFEKKRVREIGDSTVVYSFKLFDLFIRYLIKHDLILLPPRTFLSPDICQVKKKWTIIQHTLKLSFKNSLKWDERITG